MSKPSTPTKGVVVPCYFKYYVPFCVLDNQLLICHVDNDEYEIQNSKKLL